MNFKDFQKLAVEIVDKIDKEFNLKRNPQFNLVQLIEEFGELARVVNLKALRNRKPKKADLEDEFADVLIQLAKLADLFKIDLEKAILDKIKLLKRRHKLK